MSEPPLLFFCFANIHGSLCNLQFIEANNEASVEDDKDPNFREIKINQSINQGYSVTILYFPNHKMDNIVIDCNIKSNVYFFQYVLEAWEKRSVKK